MSDDNAFAESLCRTAKYRPEFPAQGFETLDEARAWAAEFVRWYNVDHRHSGIRYVSPQQRHTGQDQAILAARHTLYLQARERHPARWSGATRDWSLIDVVSLNPEREQVVNMAACVQHTHYLDARRKRAPSYGAVHCKSKFLAMAGYLRSFREAATPSMMSPVRNYIYVIDRYLKALDSLRHRNTLRSMSVQA